MGLETNSQSFFAVAPLVGISQPMRDERETDLQTSPQGSCLEGETTSQVGEEILLCEAEKCVVLKK